MQNPLVSVIIPFRFETNQLALAVQSILTQTYPNIEIILIADGASLESITVAKSFLNKVKIIEIKANKGQSYARNLGIQHSNGTLIAIQDADDTSKLNRIKTQVDFLKKHKKCDIVGSAASIENKNFIWQVLTKNNAIKNQLAINNPCIHTSLLVKRHVFEKEKYNTLYDTVEDYEWLTRVCKTFFINQIAKPLVNYTIVDRTEAANFSQTIKARVVRESVLKQVIPEANMDLYNLFCEQKNDLSFKDWRVLYLLLKKTQYKHAFADQSLRLVNRNLLILPWFLKIKLWVFSIEFKTFKKSVKIVLNIQ